MTTPQQSKFILDVACGSRCFYWNKYDPRVLACDIRSEKKVIHGGRDLTIAPDTVQDFRHLPEEWTETFDLVIFDPPHLLKAGPESYMRAKYGVLNPETWREDLRAGFRESFRCLRHGGTLIFKWSAVHIPTAEVLRLTDMLPVLGNRHPQKSGTHWIVFFKE